MFPVGCHVEGDQPLKIAASIGADCVQIFLSDPQSFKAPPKRHDEDELKSSGFPIYVHAPYRINVCSPASNVRSRALRQRRRRLASCMSVVHGA